MNYTEMTGADWERVASMLDRLDLLGIDDTPESIAAEVTENGATFTRSTLAGFHESASADWHHYAEQISGDQWTVFRGVQVTPKAQPRTVGVVQAKDFCIVLEL